MRQSIPGEVDASLVVDDDEEDFVREEIEFSDDDEDVVADCDFFAWNEVETATFALADN